MRSRITMVDKKEFEVWSDIIKRGTFARNRETGEVKQLSSSGYISNDLTIRKNIALMFNLKTFRK